MIGMLNKKTTGLMIAALVGLAGTSSDAATLSYDGKTKVTGGGGSTFYVSVYAGEAGFAGTGGYSSATGDFGDGTVTAYRFWQNVGGGTGVNGVQTYAQGGGLVNEITQTKSNPPTYGGGADVWTTNDPGASYATTPNYEDGSPPIVNTTVSGAHNVDGTIDISGLSSGTVYILAGAYSNSFTVAMQMTGSGQPTESDSHNFTTVSDRNLHVFEFSFSDAADYDQISYAIDNSGSNASNRARFMGVVVDGTPVPEPSSLALFGLGSLLMLRRKG